MSTTTIRRPEELGEIIGQEEVITRLRIATGGAIARGVHAPHVLLTGPAGHGKTTLAHIVAHELGRPLVVANGPNLTRPGDLAGMLCGAPEGAVVFIDEIHAMPLRVQETLYEVMEDRKISAIAGTGTSARAVTLDLDLSCIVGATTKPGKISEPMRDRFGLHLALKPYSDSELAEIVGRSWERAGMSYDPSAATLVGERSKGVPRLVLHLGQRVLDVAALEEHDRLTVSVAEDALEAFGVGAGGLDETDYVILEALTDAFAGRAVGLHNLAQATNLDVATIQDGHEGNLVRAGLVVRTAQGRMATELAYELMRAR